MQEKLMHSVPEAVPQNPERRYSNVTLAFHWTTVVLVLAQAGLGFAFASMASGPARTDVFTWHKTIGPIILLLTLARLAYRVANPPPPHSPDLPKWERILGTWNHRLFYLLLIALPLAGLTAVSGQTKGATTPLVGGIPLPVIPGVSKQLGEQAGDLHVALVFILLALIAIHAAAALKHQFLDRWPVAGRMPPFRVSRGEPAVIGQGSRARPVGS
jgi:cytochrome b561